MFDMVNAVNLLTFVWLTGWAIYSLTALARGERRSIHFVLLVFFAFCGVPLAADVTFGMPSYENFPNYYRASRDSTTCIVYCLWMAAVPPLCFCVPRPRGFSQTAFKSRDTAAKSTANLKVILFSLLPAPLVLVCFAPEPSVYKYYATFVRLHLSEGALEYHQRVAVACLLVVLAASALIALLPRLSTPNLAIIAAAAFQAVWLHGKRSIMVICVVGIIYGLWYRGYLRGPRLYVSCVITGTLLIGINLFYQGSVREFRLAERNEYYDAVRIDFGRDGVIKQAIYADLYPGEPVLDYRGQSVLFYATFFVPRAIWPNKPWPYAVYVTASALDVPGSPDLGWGLTTNLLEEFLTNLGWIGVAIGPLCLALMCRVGDSLDSGMAQSLWIVLGSLFMAVHLAAFILPFLLWVGLVFHHWRFRRTVSERATSMIPLQSSYRPCYRSSAGRTARRCVVSCLKLSKSGGDRFE